LAGIGGVFRNSHGEILHIFSESIGINSNNVAELQALLSGLVIAKKHGWSALVLEGDSLIIINTIKKLINDTSLGKLSQHWRLDWLKEQLRDLLKDFAVIQSNHIRISGNKLADKLSNHEVESSNQTLDIS